MICFLNTKDHNTYKAAIYNEKIIYLLIAKWDVLHSTLKIRENKTDYLVCLSNVFIILEEMFGLEILNDVSEIMHC